MGTPRPDDLPFNAEVLGVVPSLCIQILLLTLPDGINSTSHYLLIKPRPCNYFIISHTNFSIV